MITVLLIDDNHAMREALYRSLMRRGCHVLAAESSLEALALLHAVPFDVVITDFNMPRHDGLWVWREALLLRPELRGRFVLIASEPLPAQAALTAFLKTERYLVKPLSLERLWQEIQGITARRPRRAVPRQTGPRRLWGGPP